MNTSREMKFYTGLKGVGLFNNTMERYFYSEILKNKSIDNNKKNNIKLLLESDNDENFILAKEIINNLKNK